MHILAAPNKLLTTKAQKVKKIDKVIKKLVADMIVCLEKQEDPQGVGLAAPQIGKSTSLFIIKSSPKSEVEIFINPKVLKLFDKKGDKNKKANKKKLEGCLSIPRIWAPIKRKYGIILEFMNLEGKKMEKEFTGYKSIILQHEIDHLNGILFTQRALEQKAQVFEEKGDKLIKIEM
ncbi:MAG: peptide deformylase [Patescibacteria group bacterium]